MSGDYGSTPGGIVSLCFLKEEQGTHTDEAQERYLHREQRSHSCEVVVQTLKHGEDQYLIGDGLADFAKSIRHSLKLVIILGCYHISMML